MMPIKHTLFTGVTMTGKTTLARIEARNYSAYYRRTNSDRRIVVYDPVGTATAFGGWPEDAIVFDEFEDFMAWCKTHGNADLYIDEAGDHFKVGDTENHWLATRGRHVGYQCNFITQRPHMIAPSVRAQCARIVVFKLNKKDLESLLADVGQDPVDFEFDTGDYLVLDSTSPDIQAGNLKIT